MRPPLAETAAAGRLRTGLVDGETAAADLARVQLPDRGLRLFVVAHFDERKATGAPGCLIPHHRDGFDRSRAREQLLQLRFADFVRQISNLQLSTHEH